MGIRLGRLFRQVEMDALFVRLSPHLAAEKFRVPTWRAGEFPGERREAARILLADEKDVHFRFPRMALSLHLKIKFPESLFDSILHSRHRVRALRRSGRWL